MTKHILTLLSAVFACSAAHAEIMPVQDCLIGNGSTGPYQLSWQHVSPQLVAVKVNGQDMVAGLDYTVNGDTGTVTFFAPVALQSQVLIGYDYDTVSSTRVTTNSSIPLQFNYAASNRSSMFVQGALQNQGPSRLNLGMQTSETGSALSYNGQVLYSALAAGGSDAADRFAAVLHTQLTPDKRTKVAVDWSDAGCNFDNTGNTSVVPGDDHLKIAANEAFSKQLTAGITSTQDDKNGVSDSTNVMTITAAPTKQLNLSATETNTDNAGVKNSVNVVTLAATPAPHLNIGANLTDSGAGNQVTSVNAQAAVNKTVTMTASAVQTDQSSDHSLKQQVGVNVTPTKTLQVAGSVTTVTDHAVTAQVAAVSTSYQATRQVKVDAGYEDRNSSSGDTNPQDFLDTTRVQVTITPAKNVSVMGKYGQNVDDGSGNPQPEVLHGVGVQSTLGSLSVQTGCNWTQSTTTPSTTTQLTVGLGVHVGHTAVSANYSGSVATCPSQAAQQTQTYTVSLNHSLTNRVVLSVNGSVTQASIPNSTQSSQNFSTTANLGIKF